MNILQRNFFRLLRSGALNEYESLEPMSLYKWQQLAKLTRLSDDLDAGTRKAVAEKQDTKNLLCH